MIILGHLINLNCNIKANNISKLIIDCSHMLLQTPTNLSLISSHSLKISYNHHFSTTSNNKDTTLSKKRLDKKLFTKSLFIQPVMFQTQG